MNDSQLRGCVTGVPGYISHIPAESSFVGCATDDWRFAGIPTSALTTFLVPMPVFIATVDVGFVNLDDPAEFLDILDHCGPNLMAHEPSSFVAPKAHVTEDLKSAHALLGDQHQVRDSIPVFQRLIRVLKDCAGQVRESIALIRASIALPFELHGRDFIDAHRIATRAADTLGPSPRHQIPDAIILCFKQFVELRHRQLVDCFGVFRSSHSSILNERKDALA
jgi:hypothetical protein